VQPIKFKKINKGNLLHLVGCLRRGSSDARSHEHQVFVVVGVVHITTSITITTINITTTNITARLEMIVALLLESFLAVSALFHEPVESSSQPRFVLVLC
jgi:hypothetical protein